MTDERNRPPAGERGIKECRDVEPQLTAYADGECVAEALGHVEAHLHRCPACRQRLAAERAAHELLHARCRDLRGSAPPGLRERCAAQRHAVAARRSAVRSLVPLSIAASIVMLAGLVFLFGWGSAVETYAAQLAVDHLKCFQFAPEAGPADLAGMGRDWQRTSGWPLRIPASSDADGLQLLGIRRCGSTSGRVAHILYRWRGEPLSVYVLNHRVDDLADGSATPSVVKKLGEQEVIWADQGRTYAVVAHASMQDLQQVVQYVRRRIE